MPLPDTSVVDLIRDYLEAHRRLRAVVSRCRSGALEFGEVQLLVSEGDGTVLYRLKERCHALYREVLSTEDPIGPGALFDLAIGSLFHEAMKFREGFYQVSAYTPKLAALRKTERAEARALLAEFEKILDETRLRIDDSLAEIEALLDWTVGQLLPLLRAHVEDGLLARFLAEHADEVASLAGREGDDLLEDLYGSREEAQLRAARSYLASGFYAQARSVLENVDVDSAGTLRAYAEGMSAYLDGRYDVCVAELTRWAGSGTLDRGLASLAVSALARAGQLVEREEGLPEAAALSETISAALA